MEQKPTSLSDFTGPSRESGDQIVFMHCPVCGSRKWKCYVNPANGMWWCHAPEHSGGGRIDTGMPLHGRGSLIHGMGRGPERPRWSEVNLPEWQPLGWRAKRYLKERGINEQQAAGLGIVEMADRMRVIIPYFGPEGGIIYWTARSYSDLEEGPKYLAASGRHPLYVLSSWSPQSEAVLVEGVFDAITVFQATGKMAIALGGKACPRYLYSDLLDLCTGGLLVCLDADATADAIKLKKQLMFRRKVRVVILPEGEDPSSLGEDLVGLLCKE